MGNVLGYNLAQVHEAVAAAVADRPCVIGPTGTLTYREFTERSNRFANFLIQRQLGSFGERWQLAPHESGQHHVGILLENSSEFLESLFGCFQSRTVAVNLNYRYVASELTQILEDSQARVLVFHARYAPVVDEVRRHLPHLDHLVQVADESGLALLDGATDFETALRDSSSVLPDHVKASWSPDDEYLLYTGGTTGHPKGVLWRQADLFVAALGGRNREGDEWPDLESIVDAAVASRGARFLPAPPFMHGTAQWLAINALLGGNTVVLAKRGPVDPHDLLDTVERHQVSSLLIAGDAFGRPLADALEQRGAPESLLAIVSGGAPLSTGVKQRLLAAAPTILIRDSLGSSETGSQASQTLALGSPMDGSEFTPSIGMVVLDQTRTRHLNPGEDEVGWVCQTGHAPLGYLGDPGASAAAFPVIDGVRHALSGDRGRLGPTGSLQLLGRDASVINTGGEKVFAEEVATALMGHPSVLDAVVCGRTSERWGSKVVALIELRDEVTDDSIAATAAQSLARYKLPKHFVRVAGIRRTDAGKADLRWASEVAAANTPSD